MCLRPGKRPVATACMKTALASSSFGTRKRDNESRGAPGRTNGSFSGTHTLERSSFEEGLARGKTAQVLDRDAGDFAQGFLREKSLMRSDENVRKAEETGKLIILHT
jgi:hypothetical protein